MSKWKDRFFYVFSVVVFAFGIFFLHRLTVMLGVAVNTPLSSLIGTRSATVV
jgi:hypothetical protein